MQHKKFSFWLFCVGFIYISLVMFILSSFSYSGYRILSNTTSQLGAQSSPYAWVMNSAFALMGIAVVISFWGSLRHKYYEDILPIIFGLSFVMVAIFQHEPGITGLAYNHTTALLHSVFATMMGIVISVYAIIKAMKANSTTDRILAVLALVSASGLSFLMYAVPAYTGLLQRIMFLSVLAWIGYLVVSMQSAKSVPSDS